MLQEGTAPGWARLQMVGERIWDGGAAFRQVTEELVGSQKVWGMLGRKMLTPITWGVWKAT